MDEPVFAEGDEYIAKPDKDVRPVPKYSRRAQLAKELAQGDHPAFRRNIANRLWAWMMGRGLVEPVDLHHSGNPAEHAEVLQLLADALGEQEFDIRRMLRELAQTKVYQRSVEPEFDWMEQIRQGLAQKEAIEANREAALQELADVAQAHDELLATVKKLRGEIAPLREAHEEARRQEAQAAFQLREATAKLTEAQQQLAAREKVLATVQAAATAAQEAAASLPEEPEVAAATAEFVKKSESLSSEVSSLQESLAEHQQSAQSAETEDEKARTTLQEAEQTYTAQATPLRENEQQVRQLAEQLERHKNRRQVIDRQLARLRTLESRQETLLERMEVEQQLVQLAAADSELQRQQEELETRLSELDEAIQVAHHDLEEVWTRQLALAPLKPLSPEQLAWSILEATGTLAAHRRAVEKELDEKEGEDKPPAGAERDTAIERGIHAKLQPSVVQFVRLFGAGEGQPQYDFFATVDQALFLTNGGPIQNWLKPSGNNLTQRLIQLDSAESIAEELYVTVLSRPPVESERQWVEEALASEPEAKAEIIQELAWALLASAEFRFCP